MRLDARRHRLCKCASQAKPSAMKNITHTTALVTHTNQPPGTHTSHTPRPAHETDMAE